MNCSRQWDIVGRRPHHGVLAPLSAIRTKKSCGIGEFFDLFLLIDWCKTVGFDVIQLLPLSDSGDDKSPYNPLSSLALNPIYLSIHALGGFEKIPEPFLAFADLSRVAYFELKREKMAWLYRYFEAAFSSDDKGYQSFVAQHPWVIEYALFKTMKEEFGGKCWADWPIELQQFNLAAIESRQKSVHFHSFLQYLCFSQMGKVRQYATDRQILLLGDLPILPGYDSADVWANRHFFRFDLVAGSPPDYYNAAGQKWGFPIFDWDVMRNSQFAWWKRRLSVFEELFHMYRIDHVVGLFRLWAIPKEKKAAEGMFLPSNSDLWWAQGREILEAMIGHCSLLPIAEDLGTVPEKVTSILKELGICSTKVLRWQRKWEGDKSYLPFSQYDRLSLATVSTPDMDALQAWWKNFPEESIPFAQSRGWDYRPDLSPEQRREILSGIHSAPSYFHINMLQEYLALFPELAWPKPEEDRINVPGTLLSTNWTYRLRPSIEQVIDHQGLKDYIKTIVS